MSTNVTGDTRGRDDGLPIAEDFATGLDADLTDYDYIEPVEAETPKVATEFLTGSAGTGKTYRSTHGWQRTQNYAMVMATTGDFCGQPWRERDDGNSGLFDTASMTEAYIKGWIATGEANPRHGIAISSSTRCR
jgi:hypothetical protein